MIARGRLSAPGRREVIGLSAVLRCLVLGDRLLQILEAEVNLR